MDEVAHLGAVPENRARLSAREAVEEDGDDAALELRDLARAVDVREAENDVARPVEPVPAGDVLLARELRDGVRGERQPGVILRGGLVALAVDRAAARGEDDARPGCAGRLEDVHRADDVDLGVEHRPLDRGADVGLGGEMQDDVRPQLGSERLDGGIADVELVELGAGGEVLARAGREVVDDVHLVPAREQRVDDVRADEARSACDERRMRAS